MALAGRIGISLVIPDYFCQALQIVPPSRFLASFIKTIEGLDSFLQVGVPLLYMTDVVLLGAVTYLFLRRVFIPQVKYISLAADYFPLFSDIRHSRIRRVDEIFLQGAYCGRERTRYGACKFKPCDTPEYRRNFYIHLFLISILLAYFP